MKALKTFAVITLISFAAISCKKEKNGPSTSTPADEKRISTMTTNGTDKSSFTYFSNGDLATYTSGTLKNVYDYSNSSFNCKVFYSGILEDEMKDAVLKDGKIQSAKWFSYNTNGTFTVYNYVFAYNNDGTLSYFTDENSKYQFTYTNGNFTKVVRTGNGQTISTEVYEYYTDKPNKFNLPVQEYFEQLPLLVKTQTGKQNTHLMKKVTETRNGNTYVRSFTYQLDAAGHVTQYTQTNQKNNEAPVSYVVDVQY